VAAATTRDGFVGALTVLGLSPTGAVLQILRKYIPLPASLAARGVTESQFYSNIAYYASSEMASLAPFDAVAAANELETDVLTPMDDFRRLFGQRGGRLTRLATFISPEEMNSDPLFVANPSLPDMAPQHVAVAHVMCGDGLQACDAPVRLSTEDGRTVSFRPTTCMQYDRGDLDRLPAAEVAWQRDAESEGRIVVDNRVAIAGLLQARNDSMPMPVAGGGCGCATGGSPGFMLWLTLGAAGFALSRRGRRR
jgi:MYXO-CTERM domain-containing protein